MQDGSFLPKDRLHKTPYRLVAAGVPTSEGGMQSTGGSPECPNPIWSACQYLIFCRPYFTAVKQISFQAAGGGKGCLACGSLCDKFQWHVLPLLLKNRFCITPRVHDGTKNCACHARFQDAIAWSVTSLHQECATAFSVRME